MRDATMGESTAYHVIKRYRLDETIIFQSKGLALSECGRLTLFIK